jgi:hypothetical protein
MLVNKNFDVVPGIGIKLEFPLLDDTFLKMDLTDYTFKFEVLNQDLTLKFIANADFVATTGLLTKFLTDPETLAIGTGLQQYRLVIKDPDGVSTLVYKGFLTCAEPAYSESGPTNSITLPDGSIYLTAPGYVTLGLWYAISSYQRFVVNGVGRLGLDLRNNVGNVTVSSEMFNNTVNEENEWLPYIGQNTSFRINQIFGANTIRYLP